MPPFSVGSIGKREVPGAGEDDREFGWEFIIGMSNEDEGRSMKRDVSVL